VGKVQKAGRKIALLQAYLRGESGATKHRLVQYGQLDTSIEAVKTKLEQLSKTYERSRRVDTVSGRVVWVPEVCPPD
jgi:hypothetical protein